MRGIWIVISIMILIITGPFILDYSLRILWSFNDQDPQAPNISCNTDEDCGLWVYPDWSKCEICSPGTCELFDVTDTKVIAMNKDWRPYCPFPKPILSVCPQCISTIGSEDGRKYGELINSSVKCIENQCQKILD